MISFSGGKDSCVLKHLVYQIQEELKHEKKYSLLVAAELFHPETALFIKTHLKPGDEVMGPIKTFETTVKEDGYPLISKQLAQKISHVRNTKNHRTYIRSIVGLDNKVFGKLPLTYVHFLDKEFIKYEISHKCCDAIKGRVKHDKRPVFIGTTIDESRLRRDSWIKYGCNYFSKGGKSMCRPLSLWSEKNVWDYIRQENIPYSSIYDKGYTRSGCVACMFGMSLENELKRRGALKDNRFELLYKTNKKALLHYLLGEPQIWKPLTDMFVRLDIPEDKYQVLAKARREELSNWYLNFDSNFARTLNEIEERNPGVWTPEERETIMNRYRKSIKRFNYQNKEKK